MTIRFGLAAFALPLIFAVGLAAAAPATTAPVTLSTVLKALDDRQNSIGAVEADFTQTKTSSLFRTKIMSKGHMKADLAGNLAWEYAAPDASSFRIQGDAILLRLPGAKEDEKIRMADMPAMRRLFQTTRLLGIGQKSADLERDYDLTLQPPEDPGPVVLKLIPRAPEVASLFQYLLLTIEPKDWSPIACEIHEGEGESTRIEFRNLRMTPR